MNRQRPDRFRMPVDVGNRTRDIHIAELRDLLAYKSIGMCKDRIPADPFAQFFLGLSPRLDLA